MRLCLSDLHNDGWAEKGYDMPRFDVEAVRAATYRAPFWLHMGAGNIFRAFPAAALQKLLNDGVCDRGVVVCEGFDEEIIDAGYAPFDNLSVAVKLKSDGAAEKTVVASVTEALKMSRDFARIEEIFLNPSLEMVSFTITEKGYEPSGGLMKALASLVAKRAALGLPLTFVSMDNCSRNGDVLKAGILGAGVGAGLAAGFDKTFTNFVENVAAFPVTMIDKITPRPDAGIARLLEGDGVLGMGIAETSRRSFTAGFVNAEEAGWLVMEDRFTGKKLPLDLTDCVGKIMYTDRETVEAVEKMKVQTCLNPLHTAMAAFGVLLGRRTIYECTLDRDLMRLIGHIGYDEGLPVVVDPGIVKPVEFLREVLEVRLTNRFVPDTPERISCDDSKKIPVRFGETLREYVRRGKALSELTYIPVFVAGYLRYLQGVDDFGVRFEPSPDPRLAELRGLAPEAIIRDASIFGVDLAEHGLEPKIMDALRALSAGNGAVARFLRDLA